MNGDDDIIGRDEFLMEQLGAVLLKTAFRQHDCTRLRREHRGYWFEVRVLDSDRNPTRRIARVSVTLDRVGDE